MTTPMTNCTRLIDFTTLSNRVLISISIYCDTIYILYTIIYTIAYTIAYTIVYTLVYTISTYVMYYNVNI